MILLLYTNDTILTEMCPFDLDKQLRIVKDIDSIMGMILKKLKKQRLSLTNPKTSIMVVFCLE